MPRSPTLRLRPGLALIPIALPALSAACASPPPPPRPEPVLDEKGCPPPQVFGSGETRPQRIRLENRTDRTLTVFIDRCFHHTRLADVPPGGWRQPRLPRPLVAFPEGYRLHAFDLEEGRLVGTWVTPAVAEPVLEVVFREGGAVDRGALTPIELGEDAGGVGDFAVLDVGDGTGYAATFSSNGSGILTWSCGDRRPYLTLSTGRRVEGRVDARVRTDGGEWEDLGTLEVSEGFTDSAIVPGEWLPALTARALEAATLDVVLEDEAGSRIVHRFALEGLGESLGRFPCWGAQDLSGGSGAAETPEGPGTHGETGADREASRPDAD